MKKNTENTKKTFEKTTEELYRRETAKAVQVPGGTKENVMQRTEKDKSKNKLIKALVVVIAALCVALVLLVLVLGKKGVFGDSDKTGGSSSGETGIYGVLDLDKADTSVDDGELTEKVGMKGMRLLKGYLYDNGGTKITWYEFYNSCVDGNIDPRSDSARQYTESILEYFKEYGMQEEITRAENLLNLD